MSAGRPGLTLKIVLKMAYMGNLRSTINLFSEMFYDDLRLDIIAGRTI